MFSRFVRRAQYFLAAISHAAGGAAIGGQQAEGGQEELALARAAFAHHAQAFAFLDGEAGILHGMDIAIGECEVHIEIGDFQQRGHRSPVLRIEGVAQAVAD